jgi:uncharacterized protein YbjT (DUF2867 family)
VRVLTRGDGGRLPAGVTTVKGDLLDPATVRSAFAGADAVFLLNAVSVTEAHEGLMALNGARLAGVPKVVYLSVHGPDTASHLPHFGSKIAVETALRASGLRYAILRPNNFFQNDYWFKDVLLQHGVYPQPLGSAGVSRVDVRDIAEAAAIALTTGGVDGETVNLVGPEVMTGASTAEAWGRALGRQVFYAGEDMDAWEQQMLSMLPPWMVFDFRLMYEHFQAHGLRATAADVARQTALLGHAPRAFEDFARETAAAWKA